jgi:type II secretory pathway component GspD/PulD (secretin)
VSAAVTEPAVAAAPNTASLISTNAPVAAANKAEAESNIIPLIQFVDVPLTAAIENLARQAGINFILDPKIGYGQPGPDGRSVIQPNISIRWENLSAEQALSAILNNYDLQLNIDARTKIYRVSPKDPAAPDPLISKVIQLRYASPTNVLASIQGSFIDRRSKVVPDYRTSQIVVVSTDKEMSAVEELVARLDKPTRQVLIEAHLLETARSPSTVKGVDWTGTLQAQNVSFGNGFASGTFSSASSNSTSYTLPSGVNVSVPSSAANDPALQSILGGGGFNWNTASGLNPAVGFLSADGAHAVLSFLNADADTKVISTPRTITLDNETAHLSVTRASPIINVTAGTSQTAGGSQISYTNLGTILDVTPRISADDRIQLRVEPEVSSIAGTVTRSVGTGTFQADEYDIRKIQTQVLIPSGTTLVMGGLVTDQTTRNYTKVPVLGDLPVFGLAFRHEGKGRSQRNLLIFVTPTVVQDSDFQPTTTEFFKNKLPSDTPSKISWWDAGKPVDWTKPLRKQKFE